MVFWRRGSNLLSLARAKFQFLPFVSPCVILSLYSTVTRWYLFASFFPACNSWRTKIVSLLPRNKWYTYSITYWWRKSYRYVTEFLVFKRREPQNFVIRVLGRRRVNRQRLIGTSIRMYKPHRMAPEYRSVFQNNFLRTFDGLNNSENKLTPPLLRTNYFNSNSKLLSTKLLVLGFGTARPSICVQTQTTSLRLRMRHGILEKQP